MPTQIRLFIDTYSWKKLDYFYLNGWHELMYDIIINNDILLTREVQTELMYRNFTFLNETDILEYLTLLPKISIDYQKYTTMGFDPADASLIEYSTKIKVPVVTEDHPMLALSIVNRLDFIQLIDFFHILNSLNQITNNQLINMTKILRKLKNITKRKEKSILNHL